MSNESPGRTGIHSQLALCLLLCLSCGGWVAAAGERTDAVWTPGQPLALADVGAGELLWRNEAGLIPLPMVSVDVELTVTGILLHGRVRQIFHNPTAETIEVLYAFPLPDSAAVHRMEMVIGDRRVRSVVKEREEARRVYDRAKQSGKKAALLDQHRPNLFTTAAANINPGEAIAIELEYLEEVPFVDGTFRLSFPLCFTPRFTPREITPPVDRSTESGQLDPALPGGEPVRPAARIRVELRPGLEIEEIASSSHAIRYRDDAGRYHVGTEDERLIADRDFRLNWSVRLDNQPQTVMFIEQRPEASYALMMLAPPAPISEAGSGLPTETLFVVDVSGSMAGPSIVQAREALLAALDRLRPDDTFNILLFNDDSEAMAGTFEFAEADSLESAREWVRSLEAGGGTMIYPALMRALRMLGESRSSRAQRLIFLTDGAVSNESELLRGIAERIGDARLHTIGLGNAPNAYLMRKMAWFGRGLCEFVSSGDPTENRIDAFFARLDRPVMTDLEIEWNGIEVDSAYPSRLSDLHAGEPVVLYARLDSAEMSGSVRLSGHTRAGWVETSVGLGEATPGPGVASRWARARVDWLMDSLHEGAVKEDVRAEVIDVGLEFGLVTAFTSLVAVEDIPTALGPAHRLRHAAALPQGGTTGPLKLRLGLILGTLGMALYGWQALRRR